MCRLSDLVEVVERGKEEDRCCNADGQQRTGSARNVLKLGELRVELSSAFFDSQSQIVFVPGSDTFADLARVDFPVLVEVDLVPAEHCDDKEGVMVSPAAGSGRCPRRWGFGPGLLMIVENPRACLYVGVWQCRWGWL